MLYNGNLLIETMKHETYDTKLKKYIVFLMNKVH